MREGRKRDHLIKVKLISGKKGSVESALLNKDVRGTLIHFKGDMVPLQVACSNRIPSD